MDKILLLPLLCCSLLAGADSCAAAAKGAGGAATKGSELSVPQENLPGPFGLRVGLTVPELEAIGTLSKRHEGLYTMINPPIPNERFEDYQVVVGSKSGLCKVIAYSAEILSSALGERLLQDFDELKKTLSKKYGKPTAEFNQVKKGSSLNGEKHFMHSLVKKERNLSVVWTVKGQSQAARLPNQLISVELAAQGESADSAKLIVNYEFSNHSQCVDEIAAVKDRSL